SERAHRKTTGQSDRRSAPAPARPAAPRAKTQRSVGNASAPVGKELDQLRAPDDGRPRNEVVLVQLALLEAWRADVDRPAGLREVLHQLGERCKAFLAYIGCVSLLSQSDALDAEEHQRLLARPDRRVRHHERDGGLVAVVLGMGETHAEPVGHVTTPFYE